MSTFVFGNLSYDPSDKSINVATGIDGVTCAEVYLASAEWSSQPENMVNDNPATAGGLFPLDSIGEKFTGLVCRMNLCAQPPGGGNVWRLKFADEAGPGIVRKTVNGGDFLGENDEDPLLPSDFGFPVIELSTSPTLIKTGGAGSVSEADKDDIAARVWDRVTSAHVTSGTFGAFVQKLLTFSKWFALK
jgi:hypothetical protein